MMHRRSIAKYKCYLFNKNFLERLKYKYYIYAHIMYDLYVNI